ncbi:hypothetical protein F0562_025472 [Nyssa sinensis]|uniref:Uncharacterized protein n=1 Tax=Nyssa sinensis TaxID=561372 RepID=A0A5J5B8I6_9ASTE|nr:hypothetical protein F0562_025472 [Nyssa sinensis]
METMARSRAHVFLSPRLSSVAVSSTLSSLKLLTTAWRTLIGRGKSSVDTVWIGKLRTKFGICQDSMDNAAVSQTIALEPTAAVQMTTDEVKQTAQ